MAERLAFLLAGLVAGFVLAVIVSAEDEAPADSGWREPEDGVQPADPWTVLLADPEARRRIDAGLADLEAGRRVEWRDDAA